MIIWSCLTAFFVSVFSHFSDKISSLTKVFLQTKGRMWVGVYSGKSSSHPSPLGERVREPGPQGQRKPGEQGPSMDHTLPSTHKASGKARKSGGWGASQAPTGQSEGAPADLGWKGEMGTSLSYRACTVCGPMDQADVGTAARRLGSVR